MRVLVLGGTTEAGALAEALAAKGIDGVYSYAGRTGHLSGSLCPCGWAALAGSRALWPGCGPNASAT